MKDLTSFFCKVFVGMTFLGGTCLISPSLLSQTTTSPSNDLIQYEKDILRIIDGISASSDKEERALLNAQLQDNLQQVMLEKGALAHAFSSFHSLSDLSNESKTFRIFTWELENRDGIITYYGVMSFLFDNDLYSFILKDSSYSIRNAEFRVLTPEKWFGSIYYGIKEIKYKKQAYFVLLGLNRSETLIKKKVIEVVKLDDLGSFGYEVFNYPNRIGLKRKVYRFSNEADMSIWFDEEEDAIIMDHLSPMEPMYENKFEFYVPDLSFDALIYKKGRWTYEADYDARMEKNLKDRYFEMELPKQEKFYKSGK